MACFLIKPVPMPKVLLCEVPPGKVYSETLEGRVFWLPYIYFNVLYLKKLIHSPKSSNTIIPRIYALRKIRAPPHLKNPLRLALMEAFHLRLSPNAQRKRHKHKPGTPPLLIRNWQISRPIKFIKFSTDANFFLLAGMLHWPILYFIEPLII